MSTTDDPWWPWRGLAWWLAHPSCWLRSLLAVGLAVGVALLVGVLIGWWDWPTAELTGWAWWWRCAVALTLALVAAFVVWLSALPLLLLWLLDALAVDIRRSAGLPVAAAAPHAAVPAALAMLWRTLPRRLACTLIALVAAWCGPFGLPVVWFAAGYLLATDAYDTALAAERVDAEWRWSEIRAANRELLAGALTAMPLLALPVIGWLLAPQALVCGAALRRCDGRPTVA